MPCADTSTCQRLLYMIFPLFIILLVVFKSQSFISINSPFPYTSQSILPSNGSTRSNTHEEDSASLSWHAPLSSNLSDLGTVINGTGVYDFVFDSSELPADRPYGSYNWCNMPHVRATEYPRANDSYSLEYVEVIHRHHKRTPYATNTFPIERDVWSCADQRLFYSGAPSPPQGANQSVSAYWNVYTSASNPLSRNRVNETCQFPQITRGGLDDSWQHGRDLFGVYHSLLRFLPATYDPSAVAFRVTNNVITSQVAGMLISGMYPSAANQQIPLLVQPHSIDSLEPSYSCSAATRQYTSFASGSNASGWQAHLSFSAALYKTLDAVSGVPSNAAAWHSSWDHYFDNLSSRLCHGKALPCNMRNTSLCITQAEADAVFRLGEYEYSYTYRAAGAQTLDAAVASYGIWVAELAQNLRDAVAASERLAAGLTAAAESARYRHNVAHDGSISRLLAILQVETMVWPGMGAEVVFELYRGAKDVSGYFVRVLWGGQVLRSSSPSLGVMDMVSVERVLAYFDGLVGVGASKVPRLCGIPLP